MKDIRIYNLFLKPESGWLWLLVAVLVWWQTQFAWIKQYVAQPGGGRGESIYVSDDTLSYSHRIERAKSCLFERCQSYDALVDSFGGPSEASVDRDQHKKRIQGRVTTWHSPLVFLPLGGLAKVFHLGSIETFFFFQLFTSWLIFGSIYFLIYSFTFNHFISAATMILASTEVIPGKGLNDIAPWHVLLMLVFLFLGFRIRKKNLSLSVTTFLALMPWSHPLGVFFAMFLSLFYFARLSWGEVFLVKRHLAIVLISCITAVWSDFDFFSILHAQKNNISPHEYWKWTIESLRLMAEFNLPSFLSSEYFFFLPATILVGLIYEPRLRTKNFWKGYLVALSVFIVSLFYHKMLALGQPASRFVIFVVLPLFLFSAYGIDKALGEIKLQGVGLISVLRRLFFLALILCALIGVKLRFEQYQQYIMKSVANPRFGGQLYVDNTSVPKAKTMIKASESVVFEHEYDLLFFLTQDGFKDNKFYLQDWLDDDSFIKVVSLPSRTKVRFHETSLLIGNGMGYKLIFESRKPILSRFEIDNKGIESAEILIRSGVGGRVSTLKGIPPGIARFNQAVEGGELYVECFRSCDGLRWRGLGLTKDSRWPWDQLIDFEISGDPDKPSLEFSLKKSLKKGYRHKVLAESYGFLVLRIQKIETKEWHLRKNEH